MAYTFSQLEKAMEDNRSTRQRFLMHILTLAVTILGILTAFSTGSTLTKVQYILFVSTLGLLSLGILTGSIVLYFDVVSAKVLFLRMKEKIQEQLHGASSGDGNVLYNPPWYFYICEKTCYGCLFLSVISVALYGVSIVNYVEGL